MKIETINYLKKLLGKDGSMVGIYRLFKFVPDKIYLKIMFRLRMGYRLNLKRPVTFNEKLQYLKLYDRKVEYTAMVDKLTASDYVRERCGDEINFIKILGVWDRFDDIDFSKLPERFVLKCNHNSGNVIVCKDKNNFDKQDAKRRLDFSVRYNYYPAMREWPYKNVKPKIMAEEYIEDSNGQLPDYKIFTFDGQPKLVYVRGSNKDGMFGDYFDINGNHLDIVADYPNAPEIPVIPKEIKKMAELASKLSEGMKELRVDFYDVNGKIYFGELTFYHDGGFAPFSKEWDKKLGDLINL